MRCTYSVTAMGSLHKIAICSPLTTIVQLLILEEVREQSRHAINGHTPKSGRKNATPSPSLGIGMSDSVQVSREAGKGGQV